MSEFRQDIVSQHWILFAPNRGKRPDDFRHPPATPDPRTIPVTDDDCPFCPKNESLNQTICYSPNNKNWDIRVIPNKFEVLDHTAGRSISDFYRVREGIGDHEVLITRPHNLLTAFLPDKVLDLMFESYQNRMHDLSGHSEVQYVHIIQNHGRDGGASILHPHSQIFATPFVPEHLHDEVTGSNSYFQTHGGCVYCEMILKEMSDQSRIVLDHKDYLVFSPFAARVPYALRIIPKRHQASFMDMTNSERKSLAQVMKLVLQKLYNKLANPSYNYYIHSLPVSHSLHTRYDDRSYHWHLEILPRLNVWGGFELGSDVYVNTVTPEQASDYLRQL